MLCSSLQNRVDLRGALKLDIVVSLRPRCVPSVFSGSTGERNVSLPSTSIEMSLDPHTVGNHKIVLITATTIKIGSSSFFDSRNQERRFIGWGIRVLWAFAIGKQHNHGVHQHGSS